MKQLRIALLTLITLLLFIGVANAIGTYTVYYKNITSINDTLYLDFVSSVSNATITFESLGNNSFDNNGGGFWTEYMSFPITTVPTENAQYKIVINGTVWYLYNATGGLKVNGTNADFWTLVNSTGADIRVFNQTGAQLYFWIEKWDYVNQTAVIWVNLTPGSTELNIAYGNPNALPSTYNDPKKVFILYDDFNDGVLSSIWTVKFFGPDTGGNYSIVETNGMLQINVSDDSVGDGALDYGVEAPLPNLTKIVVEFRRCSSTILATYRSTAVSVVGLAGSMNHAQDEYGNRMVVGNGTAATGGASVGDGTTFQTYKLVFDGSKAMFYVNGVYEYSINTTLPTPPFVALRIHAASWGIGATVVNYVDWIRVYNASDPASFGTPSVRKFGVLNPTLIINGNVVQYSGLVEYGSPVTLPVNSTYFSTITNITITSDNGAPMNVTLQFDYAFSASVTIKDYFSYIMRECEVNTSGLATAVNFSQVFPKRTADYNVVVTVSPSATYTTSETPDSIIVTLTLNPATLYDVKEEVGYLIATFTAKDEETQASISNFTITFDSILGTSSKTTTTGVIKLYGNDVKLSQQYITLRFNATGYSVRERIIDQTKLNQSITLWLLPSADSTYVTFTVVDGINPVYQALVTVQKNIGGSYVTISETYTDMAGSTSVPLKVYDSYRIIVSKAGYQTVILDIDVNQLTYTIQIGGGTPQPGVTEPIVAYYVIYPLANTLVEGNTTFTFTITPKSGYTISEAGIKLFINGTLVASKVAYNIASSTSLSITHYVNSSMRIRVVAYWIYDGQTHTVSKTYVVPTAVGLWAVFVALNNQLATMGNASLIATLIAVFITLLVVCSLAYYTPLSGRGLGFIALIVFTLIAAPLKAVGIGVLVAMWLVAIALMIVWR